MRITKRSSTEGKTRKAKDRSKGHQDDRLQIVLLDAPGTPAQGSVQWRRNQAQWRATI